MAGIINAASLLTINLLVNSCLEAVPYLLSSQNCMQLFQTAEKFSLEPLKAKTVAYFKENPLVLETVFHDVSHLTEGDCQVGAEVTYMDGRRWSIRIGKFYDEG